MFRNNEYPKQKTSVNCLITDGGIGDLLSSLIAVNYILKHAPWINLLIWTPDYMVDFAKNVLKPGAIIRGFSKAKDRYDSNKLSISTRWLGQHTPMRTNPVEYAFHVLCDYSPTIEEKSYLKINTNNINIKKFNLPKNYVIIQGAYTEKVKTLHPLVFNQLVSYVINKGYVPVFLGKTNSESGQEGIKVLAKVNNEYKMELGINLINKTNLLESAKIIDNAKLTIVMDGGLFHLAMFTKAPIICGFTFVKAEQIVGVRDGVKGKDIYTVEPDESLECRGCQSNWTLMYGHDYRSCFYGDYKCVEQITSYKFIKIIEQNKLL